MEDIELNLTPWSLLDEYWKAETLSELKEIMRADCEYLQTLCGKRSVDANVRLCRIFVESFLKFLSNPSYYKCYREKLEVGLDYNGVDLFLPMVTLYEHLGGTFQSNNEVF